MTTNHVFYYKNENMKSCRGFSAVWDDKGFGIIRLDDGIDDIEYFRCF